MVRLILASSSPTTLSGRRSVNPEARRAGRRHDEGLTSYDVMGLEAAAAGIVEMEAPETALERREGKAAALIILAELLELGSSA